MTQLNLLPDVKLEFIKAQRSRRLVFSISIIATIAAVALLLLLLVVDLAQKKHLSDLNRDINNESTSLKQKPEIGKILTVQNQLESLTALHAAKPAASRIFDNYLNDITPASVAITTFHIDFTQQTIAITGTADTLTTVNKYVDTLKFTTYTTNTVSKPTKAFTNVVLSTFGFNSSSKDQSQSANYTINLSYDKNIFDITQNVTLAVPNLITTRSSIDQPGDLFKTVPPASKPSSTGGP